MPSSTRSNKSSDRVTRSQSGRVGPSALPSVAESTRRLSSPPGSTGPLTAIQYLPTPRMTPHPSSTGVSPSSDTHTASPAESAMGALCNDHATSPVRALCTPAPAVSPSSDRPTTEPDSDSTSSLLNTVTSLLPPTQDDTASAPLPPQTSKDTDNCRDDQPSNSSDTLVTVPSLSDDNTDGPQRSLDIAINTAHPPPARSTVPRLSPIASPRSIPVLVPHSSSHHSAASHASSPGPPPASSPPSAPRRRSKLVFTDIPHIGVDIFFSAIRHYNLDKHISGLMPLRDGSGYIFACSSDKIAQQILEAPLPTALKDAVVRRPHFRKPPIREVTELIIHHVPLTYGLPAIRSYIEDSHDVRLLYINRLHRRGPNNTLDYTAPLPHVRIRLASSDANKILRGNSIKLFEFATYRVTNVGNRPSVQQCTKCFSLKHSSYQCASPALCPRCASPDHMAKDCPRPDPECPNCHRPHRPTYRGCPAFKAAERKLRYVRPQLNAPTADAPTTSESSTRARPSSRPPPLSRQALPCSESRETTQRLLDEPPSTRTAPVPEDTNHHWPPLPSASSQLPHHHRSLHPDPTWGPLSVTSGIDLRAPPPPLLYSQSHPASQPSRPQDTDLRPPPGFQADAYVRPPPPTFRDNHRPQWLDTASMLVSQLQFDADTSTSSPLILLLHLLQQLLVHHNG